MTSTSEIKRTSDTAPMDGCDKAAMVLLFVRGLCESVCVRGQDVSRRHSSADGRPDGPLQQDQMHTRSEWSGRARQESCPCYSACLCRRNNAADPISRECFLSFTIPIPRNERSCRPSLTRSLSLAFPNCRRQAEEPKTTEAAAAKDAKVERVSLRQRWQSNNKPDTTMAIPRAKRGVLDNYVQCRIRIVQRELLNHFRPLKPNHHHRGRWNIERTNERLTDDHSIRIWPSIHRSFVRVINLFLRWCCILLLSLPPRSMF